MLEVDATRGCLGVKTSRKSRTLRAYLPKGDARSGAVASENTLCLLVRAVERIIANAMIIFARIIFARMIFARMIFCQISVGKVFTKVFTNTSALAGNLQNHAIRMRLYLAQSLPV